MRTLRRILSVSAATALALGLAACSGDDEVGSDGTAGTTSGETSGTEGDDGAAPEPEGAMGELTNQSCEANESGAFTLTATVTNSGDTPMLYTVTAHVALVDGGTVQGAGEANTPIAAGESEEILMENFYTYEGDAEVHCVVSATKVPEA